MKPSVQIAQNMKFRLGVGGHWSAHDLELLLATILGPSGWKVSSRLEPNSKPTLNDASNHPEPLGFIEIVALGDGLGAALLQNPLRLKTRDWSGDISPALFASLSLVVLRSSQPTTPLLKFSPPSGSIAEGLDMVLRAARRRSALIAAIIMNPCTTRLSD